MKLIKYYNNEVTGYKEVMNEDERVVKEPVFELKQLEYKSSNEEFEYWLDVIKKTYGKYGKVTYTDIEEPKTEEDLKKEALIKNIATLTVENKKKDILISGLAKEINNLNIKITQMEVK